MMHRTLGQLAKQCENLKLSPVASKVNKKDGSPKYLKDDYIQSLRAYYIEDLYPQGLPKHLEAMLQIKSPMLCYRYNSLKPAEQEAIWTTDEWGIEEKFDGCRMVMIFFRGEGLNFYSRNISVKDFLPINYTNIWHQTDYEKLGAQFDSFIIDTEIMCENPNVCRLMNDRGVPTETVLQAVASLIALNAEESIPIQQTEAPLSFRGFDVLMVNGQWEVMNMPLAQRRRGLRTITQILQECGTNITLSKMTHGEESKRKLFEDILEAGGEGVVAKNMASPYVPTTSRKRDAWVKIKRSMKNSLTNTGYGDTIDGWISGFQLGEEGKQWEEYVGTIFVSILVRRADGTKYVHEIARISGLSEELRKDMTEIGPDGQPRLRESYYDRVVEVDGQAVSSRAKRLKHARLIRFRDDKYRELCEIDEDFLNAMIL